MSDLIDRQAAIDLIKNDAFWVQYAWGGRGHKPEMEMVDDLVESIIKQMKESVVSRLEQMPSAQPVRHGRFIGTEYDGYADGSPVFYEWKCSECGCIFEDEEPTYNYCPNCGADMRGEDHEFD